MAAKCFVVTVTTPGTIQNLLAMVAAKLPQISGVLAGPTEMRASAISFQADPTNTAAKNVYVGSQDLNVGTRTGIGLALLPGVASPVYHLNGSTSIADFWIDIDTGATTKNLFVTVLD